MWRLPQLTWKLYFAIVLLKSSRGSDLDLAYNKRQDTVPASHMGRKTLLNVLDDKGKPRSLMPFPRLGRTVLGLNGPLSSRRKPGRWPSPPFPPDFDLLSPGYGPVLWNDEVLEAVPGPRHLLKKRPKLIPRIGRRKRTLMPDLFNQDDQLLGEQNRDEWGVKRGVSETFWDREEDKRAQFIPRVGRAGANGPQVRYRHRGLFIPRVGRQST